MADRVLHNTLQMECIRRKHAIETLPARLSCRHVLHDYCSPAGEEMELYFDVI